MLLSSFFFNSLLIGEHVFPMCYVFRLDFQSPTSHDHQPHIRRSPSLIVRFSLERPSRFPRAFAVHQMSTLLVYVLPAQFLLKKDKSGSIWLRNQKNL